MNNIQQSERKLFYLQWPTDFFSDVKIKRLRKFGAGGSTYLLIYLKMLLRAAKDDGYLIWDHFEKSFEKQLELEIDEEEDNIKITIKFLMSQGMLLEVDVDSYYLPAVPEMSRSLSASRPAVKKREQRNNNKKKLSEGTNCPPIVPHIGDKMSDIIEYRKEEYNNSSFLYENLGNFKCPNCKERGYIDKQCSICKGLGYTTKHLKGREE